MRSCGFSLARLGPEGPMSFWWTPAGSESLGARPVPPSPERGPAIHRGAPRDGSRISDGARGRGEVGVEACRVWTSAVRVGHNGGEPPGWARMAPLAGGSAEPPAEGIHKDTNGPDQASECVQQFAHLPGRILVFADLDVSASRLGHGPHLLPGSLTSPARTLGVPGEGAGEGPTSMPCGLSGRPQSRLADTPVASRLSGPAGTNKMRTSGAWS